MAFVKRLKSILLLLPLLVSCASYTDETQEIRFDFKAGRYGQGLESLEKSSLKEQPRNRLLYQLEKSMLLDRLGKLPESRKALLRGDALVDELYTTSVSKTAASFVYNDSATDYEGENFEKVAIHTILALSFLEGGELEESRVEARKINSRLNQINEQLGDQKDRYNQDAFARYLSAMIYEAKGEYDSAIIDYTAAMKIYEDTYSKLFDTRVPDDLVRALYRLLVKRHRNDRLRQLEEKYPNAVAEEKSGLKEGEYGEVIAIHEVDSIAVKENKDFVLPIAGQVVRFSFPVITYKKSSFPRTGVDVDPGKYHAADVVQNMDAIASNNLEDRRLRMIAKAGARLLIKGQITRKAEENFGVVGWLAGNVYGAVTETADTRSWTLLPGSFMVTRIKVKPGSHSFQVYTNGKLDEVKKLNIEAGKIYFIRSKA